LTTLDYLKCPGSDPVSKALPELYPCPECETDIEIWTDECGGKCPFCNTYFKKVQIQDISGTLSNTLEKKITNLRDIVRKAYDFGATKVAIIPTKKIIVDNNLAEKCKEPRCENFGLSKSCPPYVSGPSVFKKLLEKLQQAIFFKIDVPSEILYSGERREIFQLLHQIAAGIEKEAIKMGYPNAQGYVGGSCKKIFCHNHAECHVISKKGECRNPQYARPSMSGYGINVSKLFEATGWNNNAVTHGTDATTNKMTYVCGLVLVF
jgi:predicted metal-binding protein